MAAELTGSIVSYNNNPEILSQAINSFLATELHVQLYLVDNSPTDKLRELCHDERVIYIFNNANIGFGKAHNIAIKDSIAAGVPYHLVLNPDIYFSEGNLERMYNYMNSHPEVGQLMPKVLYPDNSTQYLCKLLPTPTDFFARRFLKFTKWVDRRNEVFELRFTGYDKIMNIPYLSGCFMFLRNSVLEKVGLFDERIFMYSEDTDLTRRIHEHYHTIFFPEAVIYHHFAKASHKNIKLMLIQLHSGYVYFSKWGWFFDKQRTSINNKVLNSLLHVHKQN